ncbi:MAG: HEAT repeat domain-containing protein, partial [Chloroflexi bacterium]|nr:HEAT repeat domain-containing protein [Chloroflexota bacterium]
MDDIESMYRSDDAGVRKMAVYALGALVGSGDHATLRNALDDPAADVQWNAAVALARHGRDEGVTVIRRMLDREYVARMVTRRANADDPLDPVSEVIVS